MKPHNDPPSPRISRSVDASTFRRIAQLAKIDPRKPSECKHFFLKLRAAINVARSEPKGPSKAVYRRPVLEELGKWGDAIDTLKTLSDPYTDNAAAFHARAQIRACLSRDKKAALDQFEESWKSSLDDFERAIVKAKDLVHRKYQKTGHPAGGVGESGLGNVGANIFVTSLIYAVETSGGHLTKSRNGDELGGTLIEVINLLRPHLPPSLLPPASSVRFYELIAAGVARDVKGYQN
jgi:hypothetical protein